MLDTRRLDITKVRAGFDQMIASTTDPDKIVRMEVVREFFCNDDFRQKISDFVWDINQRKMEG